jgi:hypothetical protein
VSGYKRYAELLKDPRWQRKRLEILERDGFSCLRCGSDTKTLHVHHRIYRKGVKPWEYEDAIYDTLCEDCHSDVTSLQTELNEAIGTLDVPELETLLGFARGLDAVSNGNTDVKVNTHEEAEGVAASVFSTAEIILACLTGSVVAKETFEYLSRNAVIERRHSNREFNAWMAAEETKALGANAK